MTILGIITHNLFSFAETAGQVAGNLKGSKQNFQLSDVLNILVSVTGTYKVLCPLLHSASHKSDGYQPSLSFKISSIRVLLLSVIVAQIQKFVQQCKGILPFCITTIRRQSGIFEIFCEIPKHQLGSSCTTFTSTVIQLVSLVKW